MSKFKIGDRVKVIDGSSDQQNLVGEVGTIEDVGGVSSGVLGKGEYGLDIDQDEFFFEHELEPVSLSDSEEGEDVSND